MGTMRNDRWSNQEIWSSSTIASMNPAILERLLPEIGIKSVKTISGHLEQHRLRGGRLTKLSFQDGQLRYLPSDCREHGILILLNAGEGEIELEVGTRRDHLSYGDWCVLSPVEESRFGTGEEANILLVEIDFRFWREGEWQLVAACPKDRNFPTDAVFAKTAISLFNVSRATLAANDDAVLALMSTLRLGCAYQKAYQKRTEAPRLREEAEELIETRFGAPDFDANKLAGLLNTSRRNLDKIFAEINTTADKAIWEKRLCSANCELHHPVNDDVSIAKIARRNGFMNETHFTRKYKHRFGCTPSLARSSAKFMLTPRR